MSENRQNMGTFLPDFCNARTVFVIILLAELLAIVISISQQPYLTINMVDFAMNSLFVQWVALCSAGMLCICGRRLRRFNDYWVASLSYIITLVITLIMTELAWYILSHELGYSYYNKGHAIFLLRIMSISAIVWALALRYFYVQHQWRLRILSESEARFQALQSRIKPHFLFNCMNTIASLIRRNPSLAEESIEDLADLFRASLQDTQKICTLGDEIELCKRYLRIEQHRLGDRLRSDWKLNSIPEDIALPVLSLQPLLENAIYHGIEPNPDGGTISISGEITNDAIVITILNPFTNQKSEHQKRNGNQLAQENVRLRLSSYFNQENLLHIEQHANEYKVSIIIPYT
ncbi:MAG: two-component system sensor histidine kinase AlgZ [Gammaproteobacteria bacterium]|jgi:two-component system sensor histidine kinase AlgZ